METFVGATALASMADPHASVKIVFAPTVELVRETHGARAISNPSS